MGRAPNSLSIFSCSDAARAAKAPGTAAATLAVSMCIVRICTRSFAECKAVPKVRRPSPRSLSNCRACQVS
eukprot:922534-Pyramimonas_sp.AAC.1